MEWGVPADLPLVLYRDLLLYVVYGFLKWKIVQGNGFMTISCCTFAFPKFGGYIFANFQVFLRWIIWVIESMLRLHLTKFVKREQ